MELVTNFLEIMTAWVTGFVTLLIDVLTSISGVFYTVSETGTGKFTLLGVLAIMGLAIGFVRFSVAFIRSFFVK